MSDGSKLKRLDWTFSCLFACFPGTPDQVMHISELCDDSRREHERVKVRKPHAAVQRVDGQRERGQAAISVSMLSAL